MGFLDKAKQKLAGVPKGLGEETVRVVDYDEKHEDSNQGSRPAPKPKAPTSQKPKPGPKAKQEPKSSRAKSTPEPKPSKMNDTAFSIEDSPVPAGNPKPNAISGLTEELMKVDSNKIKDVLELLDIPSTFEIASSVFLPDDIEDVVFDQQAPVGYDIGQVSAFVDQCLNSLKHYVMLLRLRNEHVAKLATVVDRLQVDLNNARFDREVANGINIMPTQDDDDLSNQNTELRLLNRRLTEQLEAYQNGDELSSSERIKLEMLQDELSIANRSNEDLLAINYELKTRIAYLDEEQPDYDDEDNNDSTEAAFSYENEETVHETSLADYEQLPEMSLDSLPVLSGPDGSEVFYADDDDEEGLPQFGDLEQIRTEPFAHKVQPNSAFYGSEDPPLEQFLDENKDLYQSANDTPEDESTIEVFASDEGFANPARVIPIYDEDDEDDPLDEIMKQEWGNK